MSHAVLTGPVKGTVTLADGTVVDVQPVLVYVDSKEQADEVADLIAKRYVVEGHPDHAFGDTFNYETPEA